MWERQISLGSLGLGSQFLETLQLILCSMRDVNGDPDLWIQKSGRGRSMK